ncbi:hypothetical protein IGI04_007047, partial [Brassica rapa subsp. trilocularis]
IIFHADILFIRSFSISSAHRRKIFCWSYTKNGLYTLGESLTYGDTKLYTTKVCPAFRGRSIAMGDGEYASVFDKSELWNGLQGFDRHDKGASCLAKLCNITGEDSDSEDMLPGFQNHSYSTSAKSDFKFFS